MRAQPFLTPLCKGGKEGSEGWALTLSMNTTITRLATLALALATALGCACEVAAPIPADAQAAACGASRADLATQDAPIEVAPCDLVFSRDVAPILDHYCMSCHDAAVAEGGVVLDAFSDKFPDEKHAALLTLVDDNLRSESMPPEGEPRPDDAELATLSAWLDAALPAPKRKTNRAAVRRLNRAEYNNTIRDLIGLDLRPAADFPSDDVGYGFDNISDVLSTSPVLVEMYLSAAESAIAAAFGSPELRERIMNPPADAMPFVFRRYKPPVRVPRENKVLRTHPSADDPDRRREQRIYDILRTSPTAHSAAPRTTTSSCGSSGW